MTFLGICSIIFDRLSKNGKLFLDATTKHLNEYGEAGLRTLALAYKKLDEADYSAWNEEFSKAKTSIGGDRETMLERLSDVMERDLILVGATAVEDKLQRGVYITILESRGSVCWKFQLVNLCVFLFSQVPQCIDKLAQAGLKLWVLTGDKMETAINIGSVFCLDQVLASRINLLLT